MFNWSLRVPFQYGNQYISLRELERWLLVHHHPEYVRRLLAWLHFKKGTVGVGGGWRAGGAQPGKPGFAPEGKSFHQDQNYNDGFTGACAVDSVYMDGPDAGDSHDSIAWKEVPIQGSAEAKRWGIHANVGVPGNGESWHLQPIEIDGWQTWWNQGRPAPVRNYPLPVEHDPYYAPPPGGTLVEEDDMQYLIKMDRMHDSRPGYQQLSQVKQVALKPGENRKVPLGMAYVHGVRVAVVNGKGHGYVSITGVPGLGNPVLNLWDGRQGDGVMFLATPDGHGYLATTVECDVIVDVFARG